MIDHLTVGRSTADVRKERVEQEDYATAFDYLTQFYKEREAIDLTKEDEEMDDGPAGGDGQSDVDGTFSGHLGLTGSACVRARQFPETGCCGIVHGRQVHLW